MTYPLIYVYLSIWNIFLVILHRYTHKYINLLMLSIFVTVAASIFMYIHPKYSVVYYSDPEKNHTVSGNRLTVLHILTHIIPLLFITYMYGTYYTKNDNTILNLITLCMLLFYVAIFNPLKIYNMRTDHIIISIIISVLLYAGVLSACSTLVN